jgi:hypothetical protein
MVMLSCVCFISEKSYAINTLWQRFVLLDNFYVDAEVSADGTTGRQRLMLMITLKRLGFRVMVVVVERMILKDKKTIAYP